jgi:hypothetical protein
MSLPDTSVKYFDSTMSGAPVLSGTAGTLKWDGTSTINLVTTITTTASPNTQFNAVTSSVSVPSILKANGLFPLALGAPTRGRLYIWTSGERVPHRGGNWNSSSNAGLAAINGYSGRADRTGSIGCRPAFVAQP